MEQKDNPVEKLVIGKEKLDGIEVYNILNLENLPRKEARRFTSLRDVLQVHSVIYAIGESVSSTSM